MCKYEFLNNFFSKMEKEWDKQYTEDEKNNFSILYDMLEDRKSNVVKVADLPMGDGKSEFILFYCNEKYNNDKDFSAIIVKKTLKECEEFCIRLGLKEDVPENTKEEDIEELFYGKRAINSIDKKFYYKKEPQTTCFKSVTVKGFNFKDCMYYNKQIDIESLEEQKEFFGTTNIIPKDFEGEYKIGMCNKCVQKDCPIKVGRKEAKEHRIIAISHARLFLLNENTNEEFLKDIMTYKDGENIKKRQILIIDEKMQMVDVKTVKMRKIKELRDYATSQSFRKKVEKEDKKDLLSDIPKIETIISELDKIDNNNNEIIQISTKNITKTNISDEFEFYIISNNSEYNQVLQFLRTFQEQSVFLVSNEYISKSDEKREFTTYNYIDIANYSSQFENTVLLDATANSDIDYKNSNFQGSKNIKKNKKDINLFFPKNKYNFSKTTLYYLMNKKPEKFIRILGEIEHLLNSTDKKVLVVTYKSLFSISDFKKYLEEYLSLDTEKDKIIHFGQFTTGVNHLLEYEVIIFLGELRKAPVYYKAKLLALEIKENEENISEIQYNEFLIDVVQQIGRTSYRKKVTPDVYIFDAEDVLEYYEKNLKLFFDVSEMQYDNKQMQFEGEKYDMSKRAKNTIYYNAISYMADKIEEDEKEIGMVQERYIFNIKEIKEAIGYKGNKFRRDIVEPLQKLSSTNSLIYNPKERKIILDIKSLEKDIR